MICFPVSSSRTFLVRAESEESSPQNEESKFGLGGPGTWFGFGTRQELNVGRLAMMGFAVSLKFVSISPTKLSFFL
jgi:hypothetical protein